MPRLLPTLALASLAACAAPPRSPDAPAAPTRGLCDGLDDDECQERAIEQSLCLTQPDLPYCTTLRTLGHLPPAPPPLTSLLRCWQLDRPRDDLPASWICLGADDVALLGAGVSDAWWHTGWHREDTARVAAWTASLVDGRTLWLTVTPASPAPSLHLSDGGLLSTTLTAGEPDLAAMTAARRAALPSIATVCAAARACLDALPRATIPSAASELAVERTPAEASLADAHSLRACHAAWFDASSDLEQAVGRAAIPRTCAIVPAEGTWGYALTPPFAAF